MPELVDARQRTASSLAVKGGGRRVCSLQHVALKRHTGPDKVQMQKPTTISGDFRGLLVVVVEGSARSTPQIDVCGPVRLPMEGRGRLERARGEEERDRRANHRAYRIPARFYCCVTVDVGTGLC